ncbi:amidohydrolase family protein [Paraglaciecola aestuariivivens]
MLTLFRLVFIGLISILHIVHANETYRGPIVDVHMHAYSGKNPMYGVQHTDPHSGKIYQGSMSASEHKQQTFERIKRYNIVKVMLSTNEDWLAEHPDLILHGYGFAVDIETMRQKHSQGKLQVIGEIAPNYQDLMPNDPAVLPYFDLANELDVPIAYHMFPGGQSGGAYSTFPKTRARHVKPLELEDLLLKRPNMRIYIMHAGWPYIEDMKALMYAHPQVYVDTGVLSLALPTSEVHEFLRQMITAGYAKRIMFGSDQMVFVDVIDKAIADIQSADFLSLEQKADIFYNNAARFFRFSDKEIKKHHATIDTAKSQAIE